MRKSKWKSITISCRDCQRETERGILITIPNSDKYYNYNLWYNKKLVKFENNKIRLLYTSEFTFRIAQYCHTTKSPVNGVIISGDELKELLEGGGNAAEKK